MPSLFRLPFLLCKFGKGRGGVRSTTPEFPRRCGRWRMCSPGVRWMFLGQTLTNVLFWGSGISQQALTWTCWNRSQLCLIACQSFSQVDKTFFDPPAHFTPKNHIHDQTFCFEDFSKEIVVQVALAFAVADTFPIIVPRLPGYRVAVHGHGLGKRLRAHGEKMDRRQTKQTRDPVVPFARTYDVAQCCLIWRWAVNSQWTRHRSSLRGYSDKTCGSPYLATESTADIEAPTDCQPWDVPLLVEPLLPMSQHQGLTARCPDFLD